jgi:hypothetical protein
MRHERKSGRVILASSLLSTYQMPMSIAAGKPTGANYKMEDLW